jgi:hypothetical protein
LQVPVLQASVFDEQSMAGVVVAQVSVVGLHFSTPLQAFLSSQSASVTQPQMLVLCVQPFAASLQPSAVHVMPSLQSRVAPPQTPAAQTSETVQTFESLQTVPSAFVGLEQSPVAGAQVPRVWH